MPWIKFEKSEKEFEDMLKQIFDTLECVLYESYSEVNSELKQFDSPTNIDINVSSLVKRHGAQLSIWCSNVMPKPQTRSIDLIAGGSRQRVDGCGLFSLQFSGDEERNSIVGKIGYFTEMSVHNKYTGLNGPEFVNWVNHKQVVKLLKKVIVQTTAQTALTKQVGMTC